MTKAKAKKTTVAAVVETLAVPSVPYRMGDVVKIVAFDSGYLERKARANPTRAAESEPSGSRAIGAEHVINEAHMDGDSFRYSTDHGAWFEHAQFALVRPCDAESLAVLRKAQAEEEDDESDEEDDGGPESEVDEHFAEGIEAFAEDLSMDANPYRKHTHEAARWNEGFKHAEDEYNKVAVDEPILHSEEGRTDFIDGRSAALRGYQLTANPHDAGSVASLDWNRGFDFEVRVQFEKNGPIHMLGRRAFHDGVSKKDNPHERGTDDRKSWKRGFKAAKELAEREAK